MKLCRCQRWHFISLHTPVQMPRMASHFPFKAFTTFIGFVVFKASIAAKTDFNDLYFLPFGSTNLTSTCPAYLPPKRFVETVVHPSGSVNALLTYLGSVAFTEEAGFLRTF